MKVRANVYKETKKKVKVREDVYKGTKQIR